MKNYLDYAKHNEILKTVRDFLRYNKIFHYKHWQGPMSEKGIVDIIGIYKTYPLAIEIKTVRDKMSNEQKIFLENWQENGGIGIIAYCIEDVQQGLISEFQRVCSFRKEQNKLKMQLSI